MSFSYLNIFFKEDSLITPMSIVVSIVMQHTMHHILYSSTSLLSPLHFTFAQKQSNSNSIHLCQGVNQSLVLTSLSPSFVQMLLGKNTPIPVSNFLSTKSTLNLGGNSHSPLLLKFYTMLPQYRQPSQHTVRFEFAVTCNLMFASILDVAHIILGPLI